MSYPWTEASNEANNYDKVGFIYNLAVELSNRSIGNNIQTILPVATTSVCNRFEQTDFDYSKFLDKFLWGSLSVLIRDVDNKFSNVISNLNVNDITKEIIGQLIDVIYNFETQWSDYNLMKQSVLDIENNINQVFERNEISEDEYGKLSSICSIVRYGSLLYNQYIPNPSDGEAMKGKGLFWKILGALACAALSIFVVGPAIVVGGVLSTGGVIYMGLLGFAGGWIGVAWGLNGF